MSNKNPNNIIDKLFYNVEYTYRNSPFYKNYFKGYWHSNKDNFSLDDYKKLPFTTKNHLAKNNESFLCIPKNKIAEYVNTSGTIGNPVNVFLSKNDLNRLAENEKFSLSIMGGNSQDLYQLLTTLDKQFIAGMAYYLGVQKLNAGIIRIGPGIMSAQWDSILNNNPTKLIGVPSFIMKLLDFADENNIPYSSSNVNSIVCIGEAIRNDHNFELNNLGRNITSRWNVELFSTYASTEMQTAFSECKVHNGCHLNNSLLYMEVLNEEGVHVKNNESGEVVITTLGIEGMPLIRYKTGDIARYYDIPCSCGIKGARIGCISGRKNQLIKLKGTTIYPQSFINVLNEISFLNIYHIEVKQNAFHTDEVSLILPLEKMSDQNFSEIKKILKSKIKVTPNFVLKSEKIIKSLTFSENKRKPNFITFI